MPTRAFNTGFGGAFGSPNSKGQLALIVGAHPTYEDGDVLVAINRRRVRQVHSEHICHVKQMGFNSDGLRPVGCLAEKSREATHQYKFVRVGDSVERHEIGTPNVEVFGPEAIDVSLFLARRKVHARHAIFGNAGAEYWFGGQIDTSHARLDTVWNAIETDSANREADFPNWPFTDKELRRFLIVDVDDFDDATAGQLTAEQWDETNPDQPVLVKKRVHTVAWRGLRDVIQADVLDPAVSVDIRGRKHIRSTIVQAKP